MLRLLISNQRGGAGKTTTATTIARILADRGHKVLVVDIDPQGSVAAILYAIPVFFAGLLFAREFRCAESPGPALAANMLGAVAGGLMENLSLVVGLKALLLIAAVFYLVAGIGLRTQLWSNREQPEDNRLPGGRCPPILPAPHYKPSNKSRRAILIALRESLQTNQPVPVTA